MNNEIEKLIEENNKLKDYIKNLEFRIYGDEPNVSTKEFDKTYNLCLDTIKSHVTRCEKYVTIQNNDIMLNINNLSKRDSERFYDKLYDECGTLYGNQLSLQLDKYCGNIVIRVWYYTKAQVEQYKIERKKHIKY